MQSQVEAIAMGFLRKVHCVTLRDKVRSSEIRKGLNIEPLLRIESSQLLLFGHVSRMFHRRLVRQVPLATPTGKRPRCQGPGGVITFPILLGPVLVWSQNNYLRVVLTVRYFQFS